MKKTGLILFCLLCAACHTNLTDNSHQSGLKLKKASFEDLTSFHDENFTETASTFKQSCKAIKAHPEILNKSAVQINSDSYLKACEAFENINEKDNLQISDFFKTYFTPYLVTYNGSANGQFTSYYEAEIRASKKKHGKYKYPIYARPNDLVEMNLKDFDSTLPDKRLTGRVEKGKFIPYFERKEIEKNGIDAPVILWGDDKIDIFLMQIQGSAVAKLDNGTSLRIGYADNNGQPFLGIGRVLLDKGLLKPGHASMADIRQFLKTNPELADENMNENPRFIFHRITSADGSLGKLGVPLTPGRSLAVDTDFIPLGSILWLETTAPENEPLNKLVIAQDIGSAIKGAVRGDYFWGHGEEALQKAGQMNASGKYYILVPHD